MTLFLLTGMGLNVFSRGAGWEEHIARLEAALEDSPEAGDRERLIVVLAYLRATRGPLDDGALADVARIAREAADPLGRSWAVITQAEYALAQGELRQAHDLAIEAGTIAPSFDGYCQEVAFRAALWLGDAGLARAAAEHVHASPFSGRVSTASRRTVDAGIAAFEGRTGEAVAGYLTAIRELADLAQEFDLARTTLDAVTMLGTSDPGLATAAVTARAAFERLGTLPYIERLDAVLARSGTSESTAAGATVATSATARTERGSGVAS